MFPLLFKDWYTLNSAHRIEYWRSIDGFIGIKYNASFSINNSKVASIIVRINSKGHESLASGAVIRGKKSNIGIGWGFSCVSKRNAASIDNKSRMLSTRHKTFAPVLCSIMTSKHR